MQQPAQRSPWITCLIVAVVLTVLCTCCLVIVGGGGYYLYINGQLNLNQIMSSAGMGPSEIQIINLSDGPITAKLEHIDNETSEKTSRDTLELDPYDIASFRDLARSQFILTIEVSNGQPPNSICRLDIRGSQVYRVVTVPDGTIIALDDNEVNTTDELDITTSSLCRP